MPALIDLTGQKFGRMEVLEKAPSKNGSVMWVCKCDCGNIKIVRGESLKSGRTKSCGCYQKEKASETLSINASSVYKDFLNQHIDFLTVIEKTNQRAQNGSIIWKCKCDCGNIIYKNTKELSLQKSCHCGCQNITSLGERKINQILTDNNIPFIQQHWFEDCRYETKMPARFDFFVDNKYLIEYDGEQHFIEVEAWGGAEHLKKTQEHDAFKNKYCKEHNIPLIRIPYNEIYNINLEMLLPETSKYLI